MNANSFLRFLEKFSWFSQGIRANWRAEQTYIRANSFKTSISKYLNFFKWLERTEKWREIKKKEKFINFLFFVYSWFKNFQVSHPPLIKLQILTRLIKTNIIFWHEGWKSQRSPLRRISTECLSVRATLFFVLIGFKFLITLNWTAWRVV